MLVVQPPATILEVKEHLRPVGGDSVRVGTLTFEDGLTGTLYDLVEPKVQAIEEAYFWVDWDMFPKPKEDEDMQGLREPGGYLIRPARYEAINGGFQPRAKITLHLSWNHRICPRRKNEVGEWRRGWQLKFESDAAEGFNVRFSKHKHCAPDEFYGYT